MLTMPEWQLQNPIDAVIFDCDGTLCSIEGIDELAKLNHVDASVTTLTAKAMGETGMNPDLYRQRLQLVRPTQQQMRDLGKQYQATLVPDAKRVIQLLQRLQKTIYIVSAGLKPAIDQLSLDLTIPTEQIFAVDIHFNPDGSYRLFDTTSPLITSSGKRTIVSQLKLDHATQAFIGDGVNDLVTKDLVTRFIGYGGVFYREKIAAACDFYIESLSLSAVLPLLLTQTEIAKLTPDEASLYQTGLHYLLKHPSA